MTAITKFLFDVDFGSGANARAITQAQLAEAETAGYRKGFAVAQEQARSDAQRRSATALERIAAALDTMSKGLTAIEARLEAETVDVAVAVGRKLAPALIAREPFAEIAALASECFSHLLTAPHIVIRVNDAVHATAREQLEALARAPGVQGRLVVLAEPDIAADDCRIEWADGGVVRDRAAVEASIESAVQGYLGRRGPHRIEQAAPIHPVSPPGVPPAAEIWGDQ